MSSGITYLDDPALVAVALSPLRRRLLGLLREPSSATQLAAAIELPRQRVNYHLRALESAGLLELVEERQRRGCVERILRARPGAVVVDPTVVDSVSADPAAVATQVKDAYAAEHLMEVAAATVRDVGRMQVKADAAGKRLLTFTIEADVRFAGPAGVHDFTDELAAAVQRVVDRFDEPGGRPYRVIAGGHPAPARLDTEGEES